MSNRQKKSVTNIKALRIRKGLELFGALFLVALSVVMWFFIIWLGNTIPELEISLYLFGTIGFIFVFVATLFFAYILFGYPKSPMEWYYYQRIKTEEDKSILELAYREAFHTTPPKEINEESNNPNHIDQYGNNLYEETTKRNGKPKKEVV